MNEYEAIKEQYGEAFPVEGKTYRINTLFFAAAFQQNTPVKYFRDVGWIKMEDGRWDCIKERKLMLAIRSLILGLKPPDSVVYSRIKSDVLREIKDMIQLENENEELPPLNPDIIPLPDEILFWDSNSRELKRRDYTSKDVILDHLTVPYQPEAQAPLFEEKIREIIPDADDRRVVQDYLGAALFPANYTRKFLLFQGEGGCGKSLLVLLISKILGTNRVFDLDLKAVSGPFPFSDLTTQTLLTASEAVSRGLCSSSGEFVKKVVGGDFFQTAQKFENSRPKHFGTFSLIIVSNNKMRMNFEGSGLEWKDRMLPILFHQHIPEEKQDRTLIDRLLKEEGSGILNWILDGAKRVRSNNWQIELTATQKARRDKLVDEIRTMDMFVRNYIKWSAGDHFSSKEAYALYLKLQNELELEYLEESAFYKRLAKAMGTIYRVAGCNSIGGSGQKCRGYRNFKLLPKN